MGSQGYSIFLPTAQGFCVYLGLCMQGVALNLFSPKVVCTIINLPNLYVKKRISEWALRHWKMKSIYRGYLLPRNSHFPTDNYFSFHSTCITPDATKLQNFVTVAPRHLLVKTCLGNDAIRTKNYVLTHCDTWNTGPQVKTWYFPLDNFMLRRLPQDTYSDIYNVEVTESQSTNFYNSHLVILARENSQNTTMELRWQGPKCFLCI